MYSFAGAFNGFLIGPTATRLLTNCSLFLRGATSSLQLQIWRQTSLVAVVNDPSAISSAMPWHCTPPPDGLNIIFIMVVKDLRFGHLGSFFNSIVSCTICANVPSFGRFHCIPGTNEFWRSDAKFQKEREREKEGEKEQYHWVWINVKKSERICYKFMKCLFICYLYRYSLENLTGQDTKIFNSKKDVLT